MSELQSSLLQNSPTPMVIHLSTNAANNCSTGSTIINNRNDIKISSEGVAQLTFNFLDEHADSSLEPGEVKTPPPSANNSNEDDVIDEKQDKQTLISSSVNKMQLISNKNGEKLALKTASKLEAEACEEKVRAILELDALKRGLEKNKRKQNQDSDKESGKVKDKLKAKKDKKRLKRLRKAEKFSMEVEDNESDLVLLKKKQKFLRELTDYDSEIFNSSIHISSENFDDICSIAHASSSSMRCKLTYPQPMMMARSMNLYLPQNSHDGFSTRGRGKLRDGSFVTRFPAFRINFHGNGASQQCEPTCNKKQITPPPIRGHSPIKPPDSDILWTKVKPSISYKFKRKTGANYFPLKATSSSNVSQGINKTQIANSSENSFLKLNKRKKNSVETDKKKIISQSNEKTCTDQIKKFNEKSTDLVIKQSHDSYASDSDERSKKVNGIQNKSSTDIDKVERVVTPPNALEKDNFKLELNTTKSVEKNIDCDDCKSNDTCSKDKNTSKFDMFAETPPHEEKNLQDFGESPFQPKIKKEQETFDEKIIEIGSTTPPIPVKTQKNGQEINLIEKNNERSRLNKSLENEKDCPSGTLAVNTNKLRGEGIVTTFRKNSQTPEQLPKHRNPFRRQSISSSNYLHKYESSESQHTRSPSLSRSQEQKNHFKISQMSLSIHKNSIQRSSSRERTKYTYFTSSSKQLNLNRSSKNDTTYQTKITKDWENNLKYSKSSISKDKKMSSTKIKTQKSMTPPLPEKTKTNVTSNKSKPKLLKQLKKKTSTPLSFAAAEFLFPEESRDSFHDDTDYEMNKIFSTKTNPLHKSPSLDDSISIKNVNNSPDTDDYSDNWENDDQDIDITSGNVICNSSPLSKKYCNGEIVKEQQFLYSNSISKDLQLSTDHPNTVSTASPMQSLTTNPTMINFSNDKNETDMQEIYNQFLKSVEETGVDIRSLQPQVTSSLDVENENVCFEQNVNEEEHVDNENKLEMELLQFKETNEDNMSQSSISSYSSSTTSHTDTSYSSNAISSDETEESIRKNKKLSNLSFAKNSQNLKTSSSKNVEENDSSKECSEYSSASSDAHTPPVTPSLVTKLSPLTSSKTSKSEISSLTKSSKLEKELITKDAGDKNKKNVLAIGLKKLMRLQEDLANIQTMRENCDSGDELNEDLLKMEQLILQQKDCIVSKITRCSVSINKNEKEFEDEKVDLIDSNSTVDGKISKSVTPEKQNKIFDANREAIKLTISPMKLSKTIALFKRAISDDKNNDSRENVGDVEEQDFTEKLVKPIKEIAIVKPIMETKESKESRINQLRSRSPNISYTRSSYERRSRWSKRSLSISPPRSSGRAESPYRRSGGYAETRYRNYSRSQSRSRSKSRSRSRSITRQHSRRNRNLSPKYRRRRISPIGNNRRSSKYRFSRNSRSSSRSPIKKYRSQRSKSPGITTVNKNQRIYNKEKYSQSPLPFKPPSPPMRCSLSPMTLRPIISLSPNRLHTKFSRSLSRSLSPRSSRSRSSSPSIYNNYSRRHSMSYERHSISPQQTYYDQAESSYYYNDQSPNRIPLDTRIDLVLNGPSLVEEGDHSPMAYDSYAQYAPYQNGVYMSSLNQQGPNSTESHYYTQQYYPIMPSGILQYPGQLQHQQQYYSNILTTDGSSHQNVSSNYFYTDSGFPVPIQQSASLLKELPKATVAVQKGNVLEIVPSGEINIGSDTKMNTVIVTPGPEEIKQINIIEEVKKKKKKKVAWLEEVNSRHVKSAVLKLSRDNEGVLKSILRKSETDFDTPRTAIVDNINKKKVFFEDGIYPSYNSEDEDRKAIDSQVQRKVKKIFNENVDDVVPSVKLEMELKEHEDNDMVMEEEEEVEEEEVTCSEEEESDYDQSYDALSPPPPPDGDPPPELEQPALLQSVQQFFYFHFDPVARQFFNSYHENPIPPRSLKQIEQQKLCRNEIAETPKQSVSPEKTKVEDSDEINENNSPTHMSPISIIEPQSALLNKKTISSSSDYNPTVNAIKDQFQSPQQLIQNLNPTLPFLSGVSEMHINDHLVHLPILPLVDTPSNIRNNNTNSNQRQHIMQIIDLPKVYTNASLVNIDDSPRHFAHLSSSPLNKNQQQKIESPNVHTNLEMIKSSNIFIPLESKMESLSEIQSENALLSPPSPSIKEEQVQEVEISKEIQSNKILSEEDFVTDSKNNSNNLADTVKNNETLCINSDQNLNMNFQITIQKSNNYEERIEMEQEDFNTSNNKVVDVSINNNNMLSSTNLVVDKDDQKQNTELFKESKVSFNDEMLSMSSQSKNENVQQTEEKTQWDTTIPKPTMLSLDILPENDNAIEETNKKPNDLLDIYDSSSFSSSTTTPPTESSCDESNDKSDIERSDYSSRSGELKCLNTPPT